MPCGMVSGATRFVRAKQPFGGDGVERFWPGQLRHQLKVPPNGSTPSICVLHWICGGAPGGESGRGVVVVPILLDGSVSNVMSAKRTKSCERSSSPSFACSKTHWLAALPGLVAPELPTMWL